MEHLQCLGGQVFVDNRIELALQFLRISPFFQHNISVEVIAEPVARAAFLRAQRQKKIKIEMRLTGNILNDRRYLAIRSIVHYQRFSNCIYSVEIFFCHLLRDHNRNRIRQCGFRITCDKRQAEYIKQSGVCKDHLVLLEIFISFFYSDASVIPEPSNVFNLRKIIFQGGRKWIGCYRQYPVCAAEIYIRVNAVNTIRLLIKFIVAQFIHYVYQDKQAGCQTNRQSQDINGGIAFVLPQVAHRNFEIIFKHNELFK